MRYYTVEQEIFVFKNISCEKFLWSKIFVLWATTKFFKRVASFGCQDMETCERACCVEGYHFYQHIWSAAVGEVLFCEGKPTLLVIGRRFCHIAHEGMANESDPLGVRKPIILFRVSKKSHRHSLATFTTPHVSKLDECK